MPRYLMNYEDPHGFCRLLMFDSDSVTTEAAAASFLSTLGVPFRRIVQVVETTNGVATTPVAPRPAAVQDSTDNTHSEPAIGIVRSRIKTERPTKLKALTKRPRKPVLIGAVVSAALILAAATVLLARQNEGKRELWSALPHTITTCSEDPLPDSAPRQFNTDISTLPIVSHPQSVSFGHVGGESVSLELTFDRPAPQPPQTVRPFGNGKPIAGQFQLMTSINLNPPNGGLGTIEISNENGEWHSVLYRSAEGSDFIDSLGDVQVSGNTISFVFSLDAIAPNMKSVYQPDVMVLYTMYMTPPGTGISVVLGSASFQCNWSGHSHPHA